MNARTLSIIIVALLLSIVTTGAEATATAPVPATGPMPIIVLSSEVEEGHKVLHALITLNGKPLKDVKARFGIVRTFGTLWLGEDSTDDEGTAAIAFPEKLPGNERGELETIVILTSPAAYAGAQQMQRIPGGLPIVPSSSPAFPRALWSARAPFALLASILGAVGAVWLTYAFVITQIIAIRKEGRS